MVQRHLIPHFKPLKVDIINPEGQGCGNIRSLPRPLLLKSEFFTSSSVFKKKWAILIFLGTFGKLHCNFGQFWSNLVTLSIWRLDTPSSLSRKSGQSHSLKILYFQVITDKIPLYTFHRKAKRLISSITSYLRPVPHVFYGLLEQINSSNEPYNALAIPGGSNEVSIVVF